MNLDDQIPQDATGLRLCKMVGDDLRTSEGVRFTEGRAAVFTVLNRASVSGHVGGEIDSTTNWWADFLNSEGDGVAEIRLDRHSWNALKNQWMKCKMEDHTNG